MIWFYCYNLWHPGKKEFSVFFHKQKIHHFVKVIFIIYFKEYFSYHLTIRFAALIPPAVFQITSSTWNTLLFLKAVLLKEWSSVAFLANEISFIILICIFIRREIEISTFRPIFGSALLLIPFYRKIIFITCNLVRLNPINHLKQHENECFDKYEHHLARKRIIETLEFNLSPTSLSFLQCVFY